MNPTVSIIVPIFNTAPYLGLCLESLLTQTLESFEILLIDDGSTDGSGEICDHYAGRDERILTIHQENGGLPNARKRGIESARGIYVGFVDSDDWVSPTHFERLTAAAKLHDVDYVFTGFKRHGPQGTSVESNSARLGLYESQQVLSDLLPRFLPSRQHFGYGIIPSACTKLTRRKLLARASEFVDSGLTAGEDLVLSLGSLALAESAYHLGPPYGYHYRYVSTSMIRRYVPGHFQQAIRLLDNLKALDSSAFGPLNLSLDYLAAYLATAAVITEARNAASSGPGSSLSRIARFAADAQVTRALRTVERQALPPKRRPVWDLIRILNVVEARLPSRGNETS